MIFHNPAMLYALPATAVPLVIHIINRSRFRVVEWAAMEHLLAAKKKVRRRVLMEHWLLLLVRTLIILALILALARPDFTDTSGGIGAGDQPVEWLVVLDDSTSMAHKPGQQGAIERARQVLLERLDQLRKDRPQDRVSVVLSSDPGNFLPYAQRVAPGDSLQYERLREALGTIRPGDRPTDWGTALDLAADTLLPGLKTEGPVVAIAVSDFRSIDWNDSSAGRIAQAAGKFDAFELLEAGFSEPANLALTDLRCLDARPLADVPARFELTLERRGERMDNVPLTLHLLVPESLAAEFNLTTGDDGGTDAQQATRVGSLLHYTVPLAPIPEVQANATTAYIFAAAVPFAGATAVGVSVPPDAFEPDDQRWVSVNVAPRLRVLLVDGKPAPRDFGGAADYLLLALAPDPTRPMGIDVTRIDHSVLPETAFVNFDVVLIANLDRMDIDPLERLAAFARAGGGVGWFIGSEADPVGYSAIRDLAREVPPGNLQPGGDAGGSLFPAMLTELRTAPDDQPMRFQVERAGNPLMEVFSGASGLDLLMRTIRIERGWRVTADNDEQVACSLANDAGDASPAVIDAPFGRGRVVITTLGADTEWSNWPRTPSFLIYVHTLISTIAPRDDTLRTLRPGGVLRRTWAPDEFSPTATMTGPNGATTNLRAELQPGAEGDLSVEWADTTTAGLYVLELSAVGSTDTVHEVVVVSRDPRESDLRPANVTDLVAGRAGWRISSSEPPDLLSSGDASTLAAWLLGLVGILLVMDVLLGTRAARRRAL